MEPGHPHFTEALDLQRSRQRAILRRLSLDFIRPAVRVPHGSSAPMASRDEGGLLETTLRRWADEEITALGDALDRHCRAMEAQDVSAALRTAPAIDASGIFNDRLGLLGAEADNAPELIGDQRRALLRLARTLAWADDLAGDYVDPRVVTERA